MSRLPIYRKVKSNAELAQEKNELSQKHISNTNFDNRSSPCHQNLVPLLKRSVAAAGVREPAAEILAAHSQEAHPSND